MIAPPLAPMVAAAMPKEEAARRKPRSLRPEAVRLARRSPSRGPRRPRSLRLTRRARGSAPVQGRGAVHRGRGLAGATLNEWTAKGWTWRRAVRHARVLQAPGHGLRLLHPRGRGRASTTTDEARARLVRLSARSPPARRRRGAARSAVAPSAPARCARATSGWRSWPATGRAGALEEGSRWSPRSEPASDRAACDGRAAACCDWCPRTSGPDSPVPEGSLCLRAGRPARRRGDGLAALCADAARRARWWRCSSCCSPTGCFQGQSLGKRLFGVKVIHLPTRSAARYRDSVLRNAPLRRWWCCWG